jgi:predicted ATPase/DNA-binding SARP family transcriptional activator
VAEHSGCPLTFLETDIVGSTRLWDRDQLAMSSARRRHEAISRTVIEVYGGAFVKSKGDGVLATFTRAGMALEAALAIQTAVRAEPWGVIGPLQTRVALHSGTAFEFEDDDYFGPVVNHLSRLIKVIPGGHIYATVATIRLAQVDAPASVGVRQVGELALRDVPRPIRVFTVHPRVRSLTTVTAPARPLERPRPTSGPEVTPAQPVLAVSSARPPRANRRTPSGRAAADRYLSDQPPRPTVRISLFRQFRVEIDGRELDLEHTEAAKGLRILRCLLSRSPARLPKDLAYEWFWPESAPAQVDNTLRSALSRLRLELEPGVHARFSRIVNRGGFIYLADLASMWVDALEFERLIEQARRSDSPEQLLQMADRLYTGHYLPDDRYDDWAIPRRETLRRQWVELQVHLSQIREQRGDLPGAIAALQRPVDDDPRDEQALRELMLLLGRHGRRSTALAAYDRLQAAVRGMAQEQGETAELETETINLYRQIVDGELVTVSPPVARRLDMVALQTPSVATLPHVRTDVPLAHLARGRRSALPAQPTRLIGRRAEIERARSALLDDKIRLLTLTGPGGSGKTRLGLHVATLVADAFEDGVHFVDLVPITEPQLVLNAIAQALDIRESSVRTAVEALRDHIGQREMLLLLDNFEQVWGAGQDIAALLETCPNLRIMTTSRAALLIRGERVLGVGPLDRLIPPALPPSGELPPRVLARLVDNTAVRLFVERASDIVPDFTLSPQNAWAIAHICWHLDSLPLAIELAAARSRVLDPIALLKRLTGGSLDLLNQGERNRTPRHQSLRNAIDWSYDLLDDEERMLFERLAVFVDGCSLEAIEFLVGDLDRRDVSATDVLDLVGLLVSKSLLQIDDGPFGRRFTMLATIREYALERLQASGSEHAVRARHAAWCLAVVGADQPPTSPVFPTRPSFWKRLGALGREYGNLSAALRWLAAHDCTDAALRLAVSLFDIWYGQGQYVDACRQLQNVLELSAAAGRTEMRVFALRFLGVLTRHVGERERARAAHQEAFEIASERGDLAAQSYAVNALGLIASESGDGETARQLRQQAVELARQCGDGQAIAWTLHGLAQTAERDGDVHLAARLYDDGLALTRELGQRWAMSWSIIDPAYLAVNRHDAERARALLAECPALIGDDWTPPSVAAALECAAALCALEAQYERSLQLVGAATALRAATGAQLTHRLRGRISAWSDLARQHLGADAAEAALLAGQELTVEEATALALGNLNRSQTAQPLCV